MSSEGPFRRLLKGKGPIQNVLGRFQVLEMPVDAIMEKIREYEAQNPSAKVAGWTWFEVNVRPQALTRLVTEGRIQVVDPGRPHRYRARA